MSDEIAITTEVTEEESHITNPPVAVEPTSLEAKEADKHYFYYFALLFFDPTSFDTYVVPFAFFWPLILLIVRAFVKSEFLLIIESGLNGLTTWLLVSIAYSMEVIVGWYVGVLGAVFYWLFILLNIKTLYEKRQIRLLNK